MNDELVVMLK